MSKKPSFDDAWADQLHASFLDIVGIINRPEPDAAVLAEAGVQLDRALFPLLSRLGLHAPISVVELGLVAGKDHSTVSRQVGKLEALGLVARTPVGGDQRVRLLAPTAEGEVMLEKLRIARRAVIARWFNDWNEDDKAQLLNLLQRMLTAAPSGTEEVARTQAPAGGRVPDGGLGMNAFSKASTSPGQSSD